MKKTFLIIFIFILNHFLSAQNTSTHESFEENIPKGISATGGNLELDSKRIKDGNYSLKWNWVSNDTLVFKTSIGYHPQRPPLTLPVMIKNN
ncbi:hypothetical protein JCM19274_2745 [Algibacter lectus]|uniref:Lyase N-terminal domain-containing protein n=1 Tax=Algibacter lectus TaxID=221126 RepID=A0A090X1V3_9FLAO|nr:chondroitinase family protein [Algibacter lectus]GAL82034.1 hypothetical protein JCM19274_2745 [Algibacter lectus]